MIDHVNHVMRHSSVSGTPLAILLMLAHYANRDGEAWPSMPTLAQHANVDVRSVKRAIKQLSDTGHIEVIGHGRCNQNRYLISMHSRDASVPSDSGDADVTSDTDVPTGRDVDVPIVGTPVSPNTLRNTTNQPLYGAMEVMDDLFERFWQAYPKRAGANPKAPARKKFLTKAKTTDPEFIIRAAERYADDVDERERTDRRYSRDFVCQAQTWLNQERWSEYEDESDDALHRMWMSKHAELGVWPEPWGPRPGEAGCRVAPHILTEFGFKGVVQ